METTKTININLSMVGNVSVNFYDISYEIVRLYTNCNEFERQKKIKHLGLISEVVESTNHTRYEYILLQCFLTDIFEHINKGSPNLLGSIKHNNKDIKGSELIKSWFLLSNFGHTINTIGDEKTLLLFTYKRKGFKNKLISDILDSDLKQYAENVINNFNYPSFHHVLSIWRIYKKERNTIRRNRILSIYKLFLLDNNSSISNTAKLSVLKYITNFIREVAYISIDTYYSHLPISLNPLSMIMSMELFENRFVDDSILRILEPFSSMLYSEIYQNKKVLAMQRYYEVSALSNIESKWKANYNDYNDLIEESFKNGLSDIKEASLLHFFRFNEQLNYDKISLLNEYRTIQQVKRQCENAEIALDFNNSSKTKIYDFFVDKCISKKDYQKFVYNILVFLDTRLDNLIIDKIEEIQNRDELIINELKNEGVNYNIIETVSKKHLEELNKIVEEQIKIEYLTPFRDLLWSILRYVIDEKYTFELEQHKYPHDKVAVKLKKVFVINTIIDNISTAIKASANDARIHELMHLKKATHRKYSGYILCCLCRINIYDLSQSPDNRIVTDIDSLLIKVDENELIIEFNESKKTKKSTSEAKKDLRTKFAKTLKKEVKPYKISPVVGMGAKLRLKFS